MVGYHNATDFARATTVQLSCHIQHFITLHYNLDESRMKFDNDNDNDNDNDSNFIAMNYINHIACDIQARLIEGK